MKKNYKRIIVLKGMWIIHDPSDAVQQNVRATIRETL